MATVSAPLHADGASPGLTLLLLAIAIGLAAGCSAFPSRTESEFVAIPPAGPRPAMAPSSPGARTVAIAVEIYQLDVAPPTIAGHPLLDRLYREENAFIDGDSGWRLLHPGQPGLDTVSAPRVVTATDTRASIHVGQELRHPACFVRDAGTGREELSETRSSITGIAIDITPLASRPGEPPALDVQVEVREQVGMRAAPAFPDADLPVVEVASAHRRGPFPNGSYLRIPPSRFTVEVEDRHPVLGRIPLLGRLFTHRFEEERIGLRAARIVVSDPR